MCEAVDDFLELLNIFDVDEYQAKDAVERVLASVTKAESKIRVAVGKKWKDSDTQSLVKRVPCSETSSSIDM